MDDLQRVRPQFDANTVDEAFAETSGLALGLVDRAGRQADLCFGMRGFGKAPKLGLAVSDNRVLKGSIEFGKPLFSARREGSRVYTEVDVSGAINEESAAQGAPALPTYRRLFAVPEGASPRLASIRFVQRGASLRTLIRPVQAEAVDSVEPPDDTIFDSPPFSIDQAAYRGTARLPAEPCRVDVVGRVRGVSLAQLTCTAAQYVPATQELTVASSIEFDVRFDGSSANSAFVTARALSPFDSAVGIVTKSLMNAADLTRFVRPSNDATFLCAGEEFLILTHSDFRAAANTLASWKRAKGITTTVRNIDGLNKDQIRALVQREHDTCRVQPSYLLLLGDIDTIETYTSDDIATDLPYSLADGGTTGPFGLPALATGRIPVVSLEQANVVVNKIVAYEESPPDAPSFYGQISIASYFQAKDGSRFEPADRDKRTFVRVAEEMRGAMLANDYGVERIYNRTFGEGYLPPALFDNGNPLPPELDADSGFAWDGDTQDIVDAFDAGRFLVLHRDHGGPRGWEHPLFVVANMASLNNGALTPVVYSINCTSGRFDDVGANNFAEMLLRFDGGGAVAVIGDTRVSPTGPNTNLTRGLFDATWPNVRADYGDNTSTRRIGDILRYGFAYLASVYGVENSSTQREMKLFHVFGDPTLEMWFRAPRGLRTLVPTFGLAQVFGRPSIPGPDPAPVLRVNYGVEGAVLTAYAVDSDIDLRPVARGTVVNGQAILTGYGDELDGTPIDVGAMRFSASAENRVSIPIFPFEEPR
jgi:hypothetical protein